MCEEKLNEGNGLTQGECLTLYASYKLLDCLQEAHFSEAALVRSQLYVFIGLPPGGALQLHDIFAMLVEAIQKHGCTELHLVALVEMLNEAITEAPAPATNLPPPWWCLEDTLPYGQPQPLEEPALPECATPRSNHGR